MKISTKVECGIIAIADIAINSADGETVTVYSVAERRGISGKYLEQVLSSLRHAKLIKGIKGSKGGYILGRSASEITLKDIIDALDPSVLGNDIALLNSENSEFAKVLDEFMWSKIEDQLRKFAQSVTLEQLIEYYDKEALEKNAEPMYYI